MLVSSLAFMSLALDYFGSCSNLGTLTGSSLTTFFLVVLEPSKRTVSFNTSYGKRLSLKVFEHLVVVLRDFGVEGARFKV